MIPTRAVISYQRGGSGVEEYLWKWKIFSASVIVLTILVRGMLSPVVDWDATETIVTVTQREVRCTKLD